MIGRYPYTEHLLSFETCKRDQLEGEYDPKLSAIVTPLNLSAWEQFLSPLPDREFVHYLLYGIKHGFRIGYKWSTDRKEAKHNMPSALKHPDIIEKNISLETSMGRLAGPFNQEDLNPPVHVSRMGVVEKKHQSGKYRIIMDLSFPTGKSINDGIDPDLCSLSYAKVDDVVKAICQLGPGSQMAKIDIKSAYRIVPVHPTDRHLLGIRWKGKVYVDGTLPFGLRSAPKIFNALADALEYILKLHGVSWLWHYLDDFITIGPPGSPACATALDIMISVCDILGIPLAIEKVEGPAQIIIFLGILLDTNTMELRLPEVKLRRLVALIEEWSQKKWCIKRDLESLIGQLHHASTVVKPGRCFIRRMIELCKAVRNHDRPLRLNKAFHSDLAWWRLFLRKWNGTAMMSTICTKPAQHSVTSDASGSWGCGAFSGQQWFQIAWSNYPQTDLIDQSIAVKEMLPIIVACFLWGYQWAGEHVGIGCDNEAVVHVLGKRSCKDECLMHLLRCLFFIEAHFGFSISAVHIPGRHNQLADALSRNNTFLFLSKVPEASRSPTPVPPELMDLVAVQKPDWTSPSWTALFTSTLRKVSHHPLGGHMRQE